MLFSALKQIVCKPRTFAVSLRPNTDTPSVVAKQICDRDSRAHSLPKYLHTIVGRRCRIASCHIDVSWENVSLI